MEVLLIDDSLTEAHLLRMAFAETGLSVTVTHAHDGEAGLALLRKDRYDLVLLDLNMPVMTGLNVLEALAGQENLPPIVLVTNSEQDCRSGQAVRSGAADCLLKPLDFLEFVDLIQSVSARWLTGSVPITA